MAVIKYGRTRNAVVALKIETNKGEDAFGVPGPDLAADFIRVGSVTPGTPQDTQDPAELTGSLDAGAPIIGGVRGTLQLTAVARGSGTAGLAPRWGRLLQACTMKQVTVSPVAAAALAAAGTVRQGQLAASYPTTAQALRGMFAQLAVNPAAGALAQVEDYTAGRVARFGYTFAAALDTTTTVAIPAQVLYVPTSKEEEFSSLTVYYYLDGWVWKYTGMVGTFSVTANTGQPATVQFNLQGQLKAFERADIPSPITFENTDAPQFKNGISRLDGMLAKVGAFTFDMGASLENPPNPEASEGYDPAIVSARQGGGNLNPLFQETTTVDLFTKFKAGTQMSYAAGLGKNPGNRIGFLCPQIVATDFGQQAVGNVAAAGVPFRTTGQDSSLLISVA